VTTPGRNHIRWLRNTAPYINAHRSRTFVLMLGGDGAQDPNFATILHDMALLHSLGVRLVLIHGNRPQIDARLEQADIPIRFHDNMRITDSASMHHVTDAAASLRAQI
jgi:amino-acid N-acetyltransferase